MTSPKDDECVIAGCLQYRLRNWAHNEVCCDWQSRTDGVGPIGCFPEDECAHFLAVCVPLIGAEGSEDVPRHWVRVNAMYDSKRALPDCRLRSGPFQSVPTGRASVYSHEYWSYVLTKQLVCLPWANHWYLRYVIWSWLVAHYLRAAEDPHLTVSIPMSGPT